MKVCAGCYRVFRPPELKKGRCVECNRKRERARPSRQRRGYNSPWYKLSKRAIKAQPYCSVCGSETDLTTDHVDPATKGRPGLTLDDVQVLCRSCNSRKGGTRPADVGGDEEPASTAGADLASTWPLV